MVTAIGGQCEQLLLGGIAREALSVQHHVDAEQRALDPERLLDREGGGAGAEDVQAPGLDALRHLGRNVGDRALVGDRPALLHVLHVAAFLGYQQLAEGARADAPGAKGVLVEIAHLARRHAHQRAGHELRHDLAGRLGRDRVDPRVHLHAGGNAERGHRGADGAADVARGAVAAGEQQQVDRQRRQRARDGHGVRGRGLRGNLAAGALDREAGLACGVLAHGTGARVDADALPERREHAQRAHRAGMRARLGAALARLGHDRRAVAALQPHGATEAGQRIHDEPETERPAPAGCDLAHGAKPAASRAACTGVPGNAPVPMRHAENSRRSG